MSKTIYSLLTIYNENPDDTEVTISKDYKDFVEEVLYRSNYGNKFSIAGANLVVDLWCRDREEGQEEQSEIHKCILPNTAQGVENFLNEFTDKILLQDNKYKIDIHQV